MQAYAYHAPVMLREVEEYLIHNRPGLYVDGTLGGGGHAAYLLERYPDIRIIGLDWDEEAFTEATQRLSPFGGRIQIFRENFKDIRRVLDTAGIDRVDGVLLDLGVSSRQFDRAERGFSFQSPNLDMRMDRRQQQQALDLVNTLPEEELADLFYQLAEERRSRPISRAIVRERMKQPIASGQELAAIVERVKHREGRVHPATKVFQALRIAVNRELDNLNVFLADLPQIMRPGGRAVIISYHSLEDRLVKQAFRKLGSEDTAVVLTKKVVVASDDEIKTNPRARSAKLRALENR